MNCPWNNHGDVLTCRCKILWHTLYPYFLGFVFGAKYSDTGECKVGCPAYVDTIVRVSPFNATMPDYIPSDWRDVIYAEVVKVNGLCDYSFTIGERIYFPTFDKKSHVCPALIYNTFPFRDVKTPSCINKDKLRCPDWAENVYGL